MLKGAGETPAIPGGQGKPSPYLRPYGLVRKGMFEDAGETPAIPAAGFPCVNRAMQNRTYRTHMSYGVSCHASGLKRCKCGRDARDPRRAGQAQPLPTPLRACKEGNV